MLHAYAIRFDVIGNLKKFINFFWELSKETSLRP